MQSLPFYWLQFSHPFLWQCINRGHSRQSHTWKEMKQCWIRFFFKKFVRPQYCFLSRKREIQKKRNLHNIFGHPWASLKATAFLILTYFVNNINNPTGADVRESAWAAEVFVQQTLYLSSLIHSYILIRVFRISWCSCNDGLLLSSLQAHIHACKNHTNQTQTKKNTFSFSSASHPIYVGYKASSLWVCLPCLTVMIPLCFGGFPYQSDNYV